MRARLWLTRASAKRESNSRAAVSSWQIIHQISCGRGSCEDMAARVIGRVLEIYLNDLGAGISICFLAVVRYKKEIMERY